MVTESKKQNTSVKGEKTQRVKIGQLILNKETVRDLTTSDAKLIRGGAGKCLSDYAAVGVNSPQRGVLT